MAQHHKKERGTETYLQGLPHLGAWLARETTVAGCHRKKEDKEKTNLPSKRV